MATSLADVARIAKVSTATVSHVLNGTRYVAPETTKRVKEAIAATGYRGNPFARALRTSTSNMIGFVVSDLSNPYSTSIMEGVEAGARVDHHTLVVSNASEDLELERESVEALIANGVSGLIVAPVMNGSQSNIEYFEKLKVPVVLVDTIYPSPLDQVQVEGRGPSRLLVEHLMDCGFERPAVLAGDKSNRNNAERVAGWLDAFTVRGLSAPLESIYYAGSGAENAKAASLELLTANSNRPRAIFATSNQMTQGLLEAIGELGLRVPEDIALVGFDLPAFDSLIRPTLTCAVQPTMDVGLEAVRLLLNRDSQNEEPSRVTVLNPTIRHGATCCGDINAVIAMDMT